jgi:hypothetical protein
VTEEKPLHVLVDEALYGPWRTLWSKHGYWSASRPCRHRDEPHSRLSETERNGFFSARVDEDHFTTADRGWTPFDPMTGKRRDPLEWWEDSGDWIPRYDLAWEHTGPLIARLGVLLCRCEVPIPDGYERAWVAAIGGDGAWGGREEGWFEASIESTATGSTPLLAVCRLIVALGERLPR